MASDKGSLASDRETVTADEGTVVSDEETITTEEGTVASPPDEAEANYIANETRIVMIGKTGSGKSSTANTLLGMNWFKSMISSVSITRKTSSKVTKYKGRFVLLIDTPGLFDTEIPNKVMKREIMKCVALAAPGLHAVVLVTKIGRFTEEEKQNITEFQKYFGEGLGRYLIIVFTGKDDLDADETNLEMYLANADKVLKQVVEDCEHRCIAVNNRASKAEKEKFKDDLLALVDRIVKLNGCHCHTSGMLQEAEIYMKLAERKKFMELLEEKRAEREDADRRIAEKHEQKMAEVRKKVREEQKRLEKEKAAVEEKLRVKKENIEEENRRLQAEAEERENEWKRKEDELKQRVENERLKYEANLRQEEGEDTFKKLQVEKEEAGAKLKRNAEEKKVKLKKEKAELQHKLEIDQIKLEEEGKRILEELEVGIRRKEIEMMQRMNEERRQYVENLQREARQKVRKDIEEDEPFLDKFINVVSKTFKWLKNVLL